MSKFEELKKIADLKETLAAIVEGNADPMRRAGEVLESRKLQLNKNAFAGFAHYFKTNGFEVSCDKDGVSATYKSLKVVMAMKNPGRRVEDVHCLLRYVMTISAETEETFTIFVQPRTNGGIEPVIHAKSEETRDCVKDLSDQLTSIAKLLSEIQAAAFSVQDEHNKHVLNDLNEQVAGLRLRITRVKDELEHGAYVVAVSRTEEEWNKDIACEYDSILEFLTGLDQGDCQESNEINAGLDKTADST